MPASFVRFALPALLALGSLAAARPAEIEFFESRIRPVLIEHCYQCHSVEAANQGKLKAGLLLDSRDGLREGGDTGPAVIPGSATDSLLIQALRQEGPEMPPRGALPESVIADFVTWIDAGASDPRAHPPAELKTPARIETADHWAFQPLAEPSPPAVTNKAWIRSDMDRFILHRLEEEGLKPVAPATARTLVRRISFDLLGLPPAPGQVKQFVAAASLDRSAAVRDLVDDLLDSPHYGERWGRHWLDVARYAEDQAHTFGVKKRENAHQYRDWVIRMFNEDLPFDQFIKRQLAGDLIENPATDRFEQLAGLGFLGLGAQYYKNSDKAKAEADELDDTIDTVTRGFMGLTVSCARCHDHKFDPVSIEDYYALAGIFNGRRYTEVPLAPEDVVRAYRDEQKTIKDRESRSHSYLRGIGKQAGWERLDEVGRYLQEGWRFATLKSHGVEVPLEAYCRDHELHPHFAKRFRDLLDPERRPDLLKRLPDLEGWHEISVDLPPQPEPAGLPVPPALVSLAAKMQSRVTRAVREFSRIEKEKQDELSKARNEEDRLKKILGQLDEDSRNLLKNIWFDGHAPFYAAEKESEEFFLTGKQRARVEQDQAELAALREKARPKYEAAHAIAGGGRAMQVYLRGNPATKGDWVARGNLALLSDQPRPHDSELAKKHEYTRLDLARDIASPQNPLTARVIVNRVWQWHFGRGLVGTASNFGTLGDAPSHPALLDWLTSRFIKNKWSLKWLHRQVLTSATYQLAGQRNSANEQRDADNRLRWRFDRRRLEVEAWRDGILAISGQLDRSLGGPTLALNPGNRRRTVYASISRHALNGMLRTFDFPDANVSAASRTRTTVPQQQLFVLNSRFIIEQAKAFAQRVSGEADTLEARIRRACQLAFGRDPSPEETRLALSYLSLAEKEDDQLSRWEQYCQALLAANELLYLD